MKKNQDILDRVEQYKYKRGIQFADKNGRLYGVMKICSLLSFIYFMVFNGLYILAQTMMVSLGQNKFADIKSSFIPITVCTVIIIVAFILSRTKLSFFSSIAIIPPLVINLLVFTRTVASASGSNGVEDISNYILGMPPFYYYRHVIPTALLIIFFAVMAGIEIYAYIKNSKLYNHLAEGGYSNQFDENL